MVKIHQLWLNDNPIPPWLSTIMDYWKFSGHQYKLWTKNDLPDLDDHYSQEWRMLYDLFPATRKEQFLSDLYRYIILKEEPGLYVDCDILPLSPKFYDLLGKRPLTFFYFGLWNGVLWSPTTELAHWAAVYTQKNIESVTRDHKILNLLRTQIAGGVHQISGPAMLKKAAKASKAKVLGPPTTSLPWDVRRNSLLCHLWAWEGILGKSFFESTHRAIVSTIGVPPPKIKTHIIWLGDPKEIEDLKKAWGRYDFIDFKVWNEYNLPELEFNVLLSSRNLKDPIKHIMDLYKLQILRDEGGLFINNNLLPKEDIRQNLASSCINFGDGVVWSKLPRMKGILDCIDKTKSNLSEQQLVPILPENPGEISNICIVNGDVNIQKDRMHNLITRRYKWSQNIVKWQRRWGRHLPT